MNDNRADASIEDDVTALMALVDKYGEMRERHGARPGDDTTRPEGWTPQRPQYERRCACGWRLREWLNQVREPRHHHAGMAIVAHLTRHVNRARGGVSRLLLN